MDIKLIGDLKLTLGVNEWSVCPVMDVQLLGWSPTHHDHDQQAFRQGIYILALNIFASIFDFS